MGKTRNTKLNKNRALNKDELIVIGIGASAGGLEALQEFFKAMPTNTNLAFVVIQHLSPDYKSLMDELLARNTSIPIHIITDGMDVNPNNIYLIPPRKNLSIFHNKLYLEEYNPKKGLNLPIDIFFRSLSSDKGKNAIGIILSGTGSDGTLGTRAIKENGGMIMVQDEDSAKFDGMPRSSIATGLVDYILHPSKMPDALLNYIQHPFIKKSKSLDDIKGKDLDTLTKITLILRDFCGIDFSYYKENTIIRRLERRVSINRFNTLEEYLLFLSESDKEKDILYREMLIGVTSFFRDKEAFASIEKNVLGNIDYDSKKGINEQQLFESREKYRAVLEYAYNWEYWQDPQGQMLYISPSCERITGYSRVDFIHNPSLILQIVHPDDSELYNHYSNLYQNNQYSEVNEFEYRIIKKDGSICWIGQVGQNIFNESAENIGVRVSNRDITKQKLAELEIVKSENYLKTIIQTTRDGFWVVDKHGFMVDVNEAYLKMTGYSRDEFLSLHINDIDTVETQSETISKIERIIKNGNEVFETVHRRKDGGVFDVEVSTTYINNNGGQFVCFCRDITQRKKKGRKN